MDITAMLKRLENAYNLLNGVSASGEELDKLAMARQEMRTLFKELARLKSETVKQEAVVKNDVCSEN